MAQTTQAPLSINQLFAQLPSDYLGSLRSPADPQNPALSEPNNSEFTAPNPSSADDACRFKPEQQVDGNDQLNDQYQTKHDSGIYHGETDSELDGEFEIDPYYKGNGNNVADRDYGRDENHEAGDDHEVDVDHESDDDYEANDGYETDRDTELDSNLGLESDREATTQSQSASELPTPNFQDAGVDREYLYQLSQVVPDWRKNPNLFWGTEGGPPPPELAPYGQPDPYPTWSAGEPSTLETWEKNLVPDNGFPGGSSAPSFNDQLAACTQVIDSILAGDLPAEFSAPLAGSSSASVGNSPEDLFEEQDTIGVHEVNPVFNAGFSSTDIVGQTTAGLPDHNSVLLRDVQDGLTANSVRSSSPPIWNPDELSPED